MWWRDPFVWVLIIALVNALQLLIRLEIKYYLIDREIERLS